MDRLISEKQVLDAVDKVCRGCVEYRVIYDRCEELIKAIPSAEPSGDLISRQAVIKAIDEKAKRIKNADTLNGLAGAVGILFDLPSVKPQEPKLEQFAKWVATEIFDEWEYNKDSFAEIACRKLEKLGIVRAKGDEWELVEPQERSDKE